MSRLKDENLEKCFSLLREYISGELREDRESEAILALEHLREITAGTGGGTENIDIPTGSEPLCHGRPRAG